MDSFPDDCLPPQGFFESKLALYNSITAWSLTRGYAFTIHRSTREKNGKLTVIYACDRGGKPRRVAENISKKTCTRKTDCPFSIIAKESAAGWNLKHRLDRQSWFHNHEPSQHPSAHPAHRQLSTDVQKQVKTLLDVGVQPKEIRTVVRQGGSLAGRKDIYNHIAEARRDAYQGESSIHALANQLDKKGFWNRIQFADDGRVTAVLFAHPGSIAYLHSYPELLILDCTYKTNKYKMPLLDMVGVDAAGRSFCIAFAFLSGEAEADFTWALDRLKSLYQSSNTPLPSVILTDRCLAAINTCTALFPDATTLICVWHANKAVLAKCKPAFREDEEWSTFYGFWHSVIRSVTEEAYNSNLQEFKKKYNRSNLNEIGYIMETWLIPWKEKLVRAWVDQATHFGNTATSRAEGIHSLLKKYIYKSTFNLFEAWKAIQLALDNQLAELQLNQANQQVRIPQDLDKQLYGVVRGWVSHEALRLVEKQRVLLQERKKGDISTAPACSGAFSRVYGLPCWHTLQLRQEGALLLEDFHSHWRLTREGKPQLLLEPLQCIEPKRTQTTASATSTKREPSLFESVEKAQKPKAPSTCSKCHQVGHHMKSKICPLRYSEHELPSQEAQEHLPTPPDEVHELTEEERPPTITLPITLPPATPPPPQQAPQTPGLRTRRRAQPPGFYTQLHTGKSTKRR
jgi:hypothetical protein